MAGCDIKLITLDLGLPDASGYSALAELRPLFPDASIMVISGYIEELDAIKLLKMGADHCVQKPSCLEKIRRAVNNAIAVKDVPGFVALLERRTLVLH